VCRTYIIVINNGLVYNDTYVLKNSIHWLHERKPLYIYVLYHTVKNASTKKNILYVLFITFHLYLIIHWATLIKVCLQVRVYVIRRAYSMLKCAIRYNNDVLVPKYKDLVWKTTEPFLCTTTVIDFDRYTHVTV